MPPILKATQASRPPRRPPPSTEPASPAPELRLRHQRLGDRRRPTPGQRPPRDSTVAYGQTITVTGTVSPNHRGQRVYLQRLVNGSWKGAATATLTSASGSTLRAKAKARGHLTYRVAKNADADHASGTSRSFTVTVR